MSDFGPTVSGFMNNISISKKPTADPWPYVPLDPKQGLILAFITLSGTSANVIGILVMIKVLQMRPVAPNVLVFGLALTDLYGIVVATLPTLLCYLEMKWYGGQMVCDLQGFSTIFVQSASGLLATIMALDRLLSVLKPFLYRRIVTAQKAFMTVCLIWVIGIVLALMPLVKLGRYKRNLTGTFCTIDWFADSIQNKIFALVFATVGITYVFVVVICNTIVAATLMKLRKERTKLTSEKGFQRHRVFPSKQDGSDRRKSTTTVDLELHFAKTVGIISFLFLICWLPFMVRIICNLAKLWRDPWADVQVSRLLLFKLVLDPFVYTLSREQCRDILRAWFRWCCWCWCCCCSGKSREPFQQRQEMAA